MSAQQLSDRCRDLGHPIGRSVIANFESGRRPTVSVAELLVFGKALGVPPVALLFPVGFEETAQPLPGRTVSSWHALRWFTGEDPLPAGSDGSVLKDDFEEWRDDRAGLTDYRWHDRYVSEWREDRQAAAKARTKAAREGLLQQAATREAPLAETRRRLRRQGMRVPDLPAELSHIDADDYQPDWGWLHK